MMNFLGILVPPYVSEHTHENKALETEINNEKNQTVEMGKSCDINAGCSVRDANSSCKAKNNSKNYSKLVAHEEAMERNYFRSQQKHALSCEHAMPNVLHDDSKRTNARSHSNTVESTSPLHSTNTYDAKATTWNRIANCEPEGMNCKLNKQRNCDYMPWQMPSSTQLSQIMYELDWCRVNIIKQICTLEKMSLEREAVEAERRKGAVIINDNLSLQRLREQLTEIYIEYTKSERPYVVMRMIDHSFQNNMSSKYLYNIHGNNYFPTTDLTKTLEEQNNVDPKWEPCHNAAERTAEEYTNVIETFYLPDHLFHTAINNNNNNNNNNITIDKSNHATAQSKIDLLPYFRKFFDIGVRYVPMALYYLQNNNTPWNYGRHMTMRTDEEEANMIRQLYLALIHNFFTFAFSCPCAPLQVAAQLVLAYALAQRCWWSEDDCFGILRYLPEIKRLCIDTSNVTCEPTANMECNNSKSEERNLHCDEAITHATRHKQVSSTQNASEIHKIQHSNEEPKERSEEKEMEELEENLHVEISSKEAELNQREPPPPPQEQQEHLEHKHEQELVEQTEEKQTQKQKEKLTTKDNVEEHVSSNKKDSNVTNAGRTDIFALEERKLRCCKLCLEERRQEQSSLQKLMSNEMLSEAHIKPTDTLLWLDCNNCTCQSESANQENNKTPQECCLSKASKSHVRVMDIKQWLSLPAEAQSARYSNDSINTEFDNIASSTPNEETKALEEYSHSDTNGNNADKHNYEIRKKNNINTSVESKASLLMAPAITTALPVTDRVILREDGCRLSYIKRYLELMLITLEETQQALKTQKRNMANKRVNKDKVKEVNVVNTKKSYQNESNESAINDRNHHLSNENRKEESMTEPKEQVTDGTEQSSKSNVQLESWQESESHDDDSTDEEVFTLNSIPRFNSPRRQRLRRPQSSHSRQSELQKQEKQEPHEYHHHYLSTPVGDHVNEETEEMKLGHPTCSPHVAQGQCRTECADMENNDYNSNECTEHTVNKKVKEQTQVLPYFYHHNERKMRHLLRALLKCNYFASPLHRLGSKEVLYVIYSELDRCPGYCNLLALFPELLHAHHASLSFTLFGDGPLPIDVRLMIAIMAASRHCCHSLVSRFAAIMLHHYGDSRLEDEYVDEDILELLYMEEELEEEEEEKLKEWELKEELTRMQYNKSLGRQHTRCTEMTQRIGRQPFASPTFAKAHQTLPSNQKYNKTKMWNELGMGKERRVREKWLSHHPPDRLCQLQEIIALAAHTPWRLTEQHMTELLNNKWTIPQLMHCIAIVAIVIPLCSFVEGMFMPMKPWTALVLPPHFREELLEDAKRSYERNLRKEPSYTKVNSSIQLTGSSVDLYSSQGSTHECTGSYYNNNRFGSVNMKSSSDTVQYTACVAPEYPTQEPNATSYNQQYNINTKQNKSNNNNINSSCKEELRECGKSVRHNSSDSDDNNSRNSGDDDRVCKNHGKSEKQPEQLQQLHNSIRNNSRKVECKIEQKENDLLLRITNLFTRFTGFPEIKSRQRIGRASSKDNKSLSRNEFNWEDMGAFIMEQYYSGAATLISRELNAFTDIIRELNELDCVGIRKSSSSSSWYTFYSLRMYILNLIGVTEDGYAYNDINSVLCIAAKQFAQILTLRPETLSRSDLKTFYCKNLTTICNKWLHDAESYVCDVNDKKREQHTNMCNTNDNSNNKSNNENNKAIFTEFVSPFDSLSYNQVMRERELYALSERSLKSPTSKKTYTNANNSTDSSRSTMTRKNSSYEKSEPNLNEASFDVSYNKCSSANNTTSEHSIIMTRLAQGINWQDDDMLQTALALQEERVLLLIALATMEARKEGLLNMLLYRLSAAINRL